MNTSEHYYKEITKALPETDFWTQVRRTENGVAVSEEQIEMIVEQVTRQLRLTSDDRLLDLCCGNGALSERILQRCKGGLGVDYSEYLVSVANKYFANPDRIFVCADVSAFVDAPSDCQFEKGLCYGSFQFLPKDAAIPFVEKLFHNFSMTHFLIGNIPDRNLADTFFKRRDITDYKLDDNTSAIGRWWSPTELAGNASRIGWTTEVLRMPNEYHSSSYRFDLLLIR
ncbi:MAG: class I SAM-dependent methyltransferase [Bdellovibrionales bacterium]|nr:class I SAM-dependent methyltransferase [Bdellovibrionales bacterium]